eukprot:TRINITY_DN326_c0_g1_i12.p1 TRINITY_DN326_c0_g1~~TRINITY_DN326_c0_g1_i12.p1  ORF type:complete len:100 (+),score=11.15 TRINITY_DN326_c0_g1_i12:1-300(+)
MNLNIVYCASLYIKLNKIINQSSKLKQSPEAFCSLSLTESNLLILGLKLAGSLLNVIPMRAKNLFIPSTKLEGLLALHLTPFIPSQTCLLYTSPSPRDS